MGTRGVRAIVMSVGFCMLAMMDLGCEGCDKKPTESAPSPGPTVGDASPAAAAPPPKKETGNTNIKERGSPLPGVDESFRAAKSLGLLDDWQKVAPFKPKKFDGMKPAEEDLAVGAFLADVAVVAGNDKKPVSREVFDQARSAVELLKPSPEDEALLNDLTKSLKQSTGDEAKMRKELNRFVAASLPVLLEDPTKISMANLALAGGYLRTLAVTSKVIATRGAAAAATDAGAGALGLLHRDQENAYFIGALNALDPSLRAEKAVQQAIDAMGKIKPNVDNENPTLDDAKAIASALAAYSS